MFVLGILKLTRPEPAVDVPDALSLSAGALARHYDYLERELAGREWFLGAFSLVDIALTPHLRSAAFMGYPPDATAHPGPHRVARARRGASRAQARDARARRGLSRPHSSPTACSTRSGCTGAATGSSSRCAWGWAHGWPTSSRTTARSCRRFRDPLSQSRGGAGGRRSLRRMARGYHREGADVSCCAEFDCGNAVHRGMPRGGDHLPERTLVARLVRLSIS